MSLSLKQPQALPRLPDDYTDLYDSLLPYNYLGATCDCMGYSQPIEKCPHLQDQEFNLFLQSIPSRISLIEKDPDNADQLKTSLYYKVIERLSYNHHCRYSLTQPHQQRDPNATESAKSPKHKDEALAPLINEHSDSPLIDIPQSSNMHPPCHIYSSILQIFNIDPNDAIDSNTKVVTSHIQFRPPARPERFANMMCNLSLGANIFLFCVKVVAYFASNSMAILASMIDSAMDILSGVVLLVSGCIGRRGVTCYQRQAHETENMRFMYGNRCDSLGVICFSCINATLCLSVALSSAQAIFDIASGNVPDVSFDWLPMTIMIFTIVLKIVLYFLVNHAMKGGYKVNVLHGFRSDHRNDTITNTLSFIGVMLATNISGLEYFDPCTSLVFLLFITYNWITNALDEMKQVIGITAEEEDQKQIMIRLLSQFICISSVEKIENLLCYTSGSQKIVELRVTMVDTCDLKQAHHVQQIIQTEMEQYQDIERCYVHCECNGCYNTFDAAVEAREERG